MSGDLQRQPSLETILRPGQIVGESYRVDKLMAEGGMAAVWAGVNQRTGKRVALKVTLRALASIGEAAELFRREALAASKINHPNVVTIFDVIDHESMTCIVMERLDGETLDSYLARNGPLGLRETVALLLPAMRGVGAAHAQGVVHRDLKPGNIFLCSGPDGRLLTTKVLDFGIATMMGRAGESPTAMDLFVKLGTPVYMSPEAIQCSPSIDGRADVYGFGVLMFEALTGQLPFPGEPGPELFARILTDPPPKVTAYRSDLPPEVDCIIDRALAKNANERFPDMDHLIRAVEDNLLSPSLGQRALTPMQGTSLSHASETKVLFALAGFSQQTTDRASGTPRKRRRLPFLADIGRILRQRTAIGAGLLGVLTLTVWLALASGRPSGRGTDKGLSSGSYQPAAPALGPQVSPLLSTPASSLAPSSPSDFAEANEGVPPAAQPVPTPMRRPLAPARTARHAVTALVRPIARPATPLASKRLSLQVPATPRPRTTALPDRLSAPRAGTLSPSDF